jgi:SAM-dependent methyltransferase
VSYDPTIYRGSAAHYRAGRPPYSAELESILAREVGLNGTGLLLDAGCGPGILALRLAGLFEEVVGLDADPDMLAEASRQAAAQGVTNVGWVQGLAEELPGIAPGPYRLVTFGQSLHWTREGRVAEAVFDLLEPGGAMAMVVHTVKDRPRPANPGHPPIPHDELTALVAKYLGPRKRAGQGLAPTRTHRFEDVLVETRFGPPETFFAPGRPDVVRDSESVLSGYFSMATSAPHLFGDRHHAFAREVRQLLLARSPTGLFWDWPGDTEIVLARKLRTAEG